MSDQIGFHYQRYAAEQAVDDFIGKLEAIGRATGGQRRPPPDAGEHHSRRRELLGILPQRRRRFPRGRCIAASCSIRKIKPVRVCDYLPAVPGHRQARPPVPRQLDPAQLRHLDRPSRVQPRLGPALRDAAAPAWACTRAKIETGRAARPGMGGDCTSPKGATGSGGSATATPAPRTACSIGSSASTCKTSTLVLGEQPPAELARAHQPGASSPAAAHRAHGLAEREGGRAADLLRVDQRRALRLRRFARNDEHGPGGAASRISISASTPSGCCCGSDARGGTFRERLADVEALRVAFLQPQGFELFDPPGRGNGICPSSSATTACRWPSRAIEAAADLIFELAHSLPQPGA